MQRTVLGDGLDIGRVVTGLWQVADIERAKKLDIDAATDELAAYVADGFDTFDMADHYGSAEDIAGRLLARGVPARVLTKWCPTPAKMTAEVVRTGISRSLDRLRTDRIDLLQLHWWSFAHPAYLDAMAELARLQEEGAISELGVTNFDTDHLRVLLGQGFRIASNQVSFSLLDRRAAEEMTALCLERGVRLLAYGTLGRRILERTLARRAGTGTLPKFPTGAARNTGGSSMPPVDGMRSRTCCAQRRASRRGTAPRSRTWPPAGFWTGRPWPR